ncbi:hypothetical protein KR018_011480, partial [Drosophila ironensis]
MPPGTQLTSDSDLDVVLEEFKTRHERRNSSGSAKYTCTQPDCAATFKRLEHLDRHEFHHTGVKKHACAYEGCDKAYTILSHLKRHLRSTHERPAVAAPQKNIPCSVAGCAKLFSSPCNMLRHVREAHERPREYPCTHCAARFSQKLKLRRHEIREHTQAYPYRCGKCARGFYQLWQRESHEGSCKEYPCPGCPMRFDKWSLYTKHCRETLHARSRHKCDHCSTAYDRPSDLRHHIEAKHKGQQGAVFTCPEEGCGRSYAYERNLRQHRLSAHRGRRFECQALECGRCFSSGQNLAKHMVRDHGENENAKKTSPKKGNPRKRRRDAGRSKQSQLAKLTCLRLDKEQDQAVRQRLPEALDELEELLKGAQQESQQQERSDGEASKTE